ncbi:MAG TPA: phosphoribosyltransferase family protein [Gammaproteobacteria bacterium]|nr:phosphoribosyltransferase family protein [Gammaproteobacteria bacterium]
MDGRWSKLIEGLGPYNRLKINHFSAWLPARCVLCAETTRGPTLCRGCLGDLPWRGHSKLRAAGELHASFHYAFPIVECIGRAKLGGDCGLARQLGGWMAARPVPAAQACEIVCAVPQHWRRAIGRGYNQALEIAKPIAAALGRPLWTDVLKRSAGAPQRGLGRGARLRNLSGHMRAGAAVAGRRVLVIDDVTTTGATFREAARALRAAGAATVVCWAAAAVD